MFLLYFRIIYSISQSNIRVTLFLHIRFVNTIIGSKQRKPSIIIIYNIFSIKIQALIKNFGFSMPVVLSVLTLRLPYCLQPVFRQIMSNGFAILLIVPVCTFTAPSVIFKIFLNLRNQLLCILVII